MVEFKACGGYAEVKVTLWTGSKNIEKERYELFQKYCEVRHSHGQMQFMTYEEFNNFFHHNCNSNKIVDLFNSNSQLVGSILLDNLNDGYSAVYSFFNPKLKKGD